VTYYFYTTHNKKLLYNPNTSIYMSFRTPQDHKAAGRDTTLLTPSSTRQEDPVETTRRRSRSLLPLAVVSVLVLLVMNYIVVELILLMVKYIVDLMICCGQLYCGFDDMCVILILCYIYCCCVSYCCIIYLF
jgi:hypothetical protein